MTLLLALLAILLQPIRPPADFSAGLWQSRAVVSLYFVGREWPCGDETCFAGWEINFDDAAGPVTGP